MKTLYQYINEKLVLNNDSKVRKSHTFKIDLDSAAEAKSISDAIKDVYGETGITVVDGKWSNIIISGYTLDDFLKVCGLILVAWNINGPDDIMDYKGDAQDENDLAFYVPDCPEIKENIDTIEQYADAWIRWFKTHELVE